MNTRTIDKRATKAARARHNAGVAKLKEIFAYDPAKAERPRHRHADPAAKKRRRVVRLARRRNR